MNAKRIRGEDDLKTRPRPNPRESDTATVAILNPGSFKGSSTPLTLVSSHLEHDIAGRAQSKLKLHVNSSVMAASNVTPESIIITAKDADELLEHPEVPPRVCTRKPLLRLTSNEEPP